MRLLMNGDEIDLKASHELMSHLGRLRAEQYAEMQIDAHDGSSMVLLKNGDRALVRYCTRLEEVYRAESDCVGVDQVPFRRADGSIEQLPQSATVHVMEAYQALIHFIRSGGMSEALQWQNAA